MMPGNGVSFKHLRGAAAEMAAAAAPWRRAHGALSAMLVVQGMHSSLGSGVTTPGRPPVAAEVDGHSRSVQMPIGDGCCPCAAERLHRC